MDDDMVVRALAAAAATAIVRAMGSATWTAIRTRWARALGRGDGVQQEAIGRRLDETAAGLGNETDRHAAEQDAVAEWRGALRTLLAEHPELVAAVRSEVGDAAEDTQQSGGIRQSAVVHGGTSVQSGRDTRLS